MTKRLSEVAPIQAASARGDLERTMALVESLAPNESTLRISCGIAIENGHVQVARYLLAKGASVNDMLWWALKAGTIPVFELLVECGWDVNAHDPWGSQALRSCLGDESVVRWLLARGVDPNVGIYRHDPSRMTVVSNSGEALETATWSSISVFDLLLEHGAILENAYPLHIIARGENKIPMMKHLLELGVDINRVDQPDYEYKRGGTALHIAIEYHAIGNVRFLLENGANPHVKNCWGQSTLAIAEKEATFFRSMEIVDIIKQALGPP